MHYSNGDKHTGEFKDNKREGRGKVKNNWIGVMEYINGDKYEGQWENNKRSGQGYCLS